MSEMKFGDPVLADSDVHGIGSNYPKPMLKYIIFFCILYYMMMYVLGAFKQAFPGVAIPVSPYLLLVIASVVINGVFRKKHGRGFLKFEYIKIVAWSFAYDLFIFFHPVFQAFGAKILSYPVNFNFSYTMLFHLGLIMLGYSRYSTRSFISRLVGLS